MVLGDVAELACATAHRSVPVLPSSAVLVTSKVESSHLCSKLRSSGASGRLRLAFGRRHTTAASLVVASRPAASPEVDLRPRSDSAAFNVNIADFSVECLWISNEDTNAPRANNERRFRSLISSPTSRATIAGYHHRCHLHGALERAARHTPDPMPASCEVSCEQPENGRSANQ